MKLIITISVTVTNQDMKTGMAIFKGANLRPRFHRMTRLIVAFTWDCTDPIPFGSYIRTQTKSLSKLIRFDPIQKRSRVNGWDRIRTGTDRQWREKIENPSFPLQRRKSEIIKEYNRAQISKYLIKDKTKVYQTAAKSS